MHHVQDSNSSTDMQYNLTLALHKKIHPEPVTKRITAFTEKKNTKCEKMYYFLLIIPL